MLFLWPYGLASWLALKTLPAGVKKKAAVLVNCRQTLGAERPPADTDQEARALIPMTTRKFIIPITLVSLEVDPYPVKPPDEKAAQLTLR